MTRRRLIVGLLTIPASGVTAICPFDVVQAQDRPATVGEKGGPAAVIPLMASGPVTSRDDGQIIENLDLRATSGNGITVVHRGVRVRNCRIRHAGGHGVHAVGVTGLVLQDLEIDHVGAPASGAGPSIDRNNVNIESCANATIRRVKASRGSSNIYVRRSAGIRLSSLELHDARGPSPRGQNVQFNQSPDSTLEDFSAVNGPESWTEDNISVFRSDRCIIRRGLVFYNNSPTGDGVMIEGSFDGIVEDVDAVQQGNGAFAAVPQGEAGSGGCTFLRCRTRDTYNSSRDGRPAPSSDGLSFYMRISPGAQRHTIADCHYDALANPKNLIWDLRAVNAAWSFSRQRFDPRTPLRLAFGW